MKVLLLAQSVQGDGVGEVVYNIYSSLKKSGVICDVATYQDEIDCRERVATIRANGDRYIVLKPVKEAGVIAYSKAVYRLCVSGGYDAIHAHTGLLGFLAAKAAKKAGIKSRVLHGHGAFIVGNRIVAGLQEMFFPRLNRKYGTSLVSCSREAGEFNFKKNYKVIPNFIPSDRILTPTAEEILEAKRRMGLDGKVVLGFIGVLDDNKNPLFLLKVTSELLKRGYDVKTVLVGEGEQRRRIEADIKKMGLDDKVILLGQRRDCDVLVHCFDCYVTASKSEGMSMSLIQAQMAGKSCFVSSLIPDMSDIKLGLFEKVVGFDEKKWADAIARRIDDRTLKISREEAIAKMRGGKDFEHEAIEEYIRMYEC